MKPFRPPTAHATRAILITCVGLQLLALVMGTAFDQRLLLNAGLVPARLTGEVIGLNGALPAPLTLITHIFLHGGLAHLAMNMVFLAWIGRQVEWLIGPARLVLLFLAGGIAASFMIPAPAWFIALDLLLAYIPMAWLAVQIGARMKGEGIQR